MFSKTTLHDKSWEPAVSVPFDWIWSLRGVVAVPLVCIGGGCGELNGEKAPSTAPGIYEEW